DRGGDAERLAKRQARAAHRVDDEAIGRLVEDGLTEVGDHPAAVEDGIDRVPIRLMRGIVRKGLRGSIRDDLCTTRDDGRFECRRRYDTDSMTTSDEPLGQRKGRRYVAAAVPGDDEEASTRHRVPSDLATGELRAVNEQSI